MSAKKRKQSQHSRAPRQDRLDLISNIYSRVGAATESFAPDDIGIYLAYLFGEIAGDGVVDMPSDLPLVRILVAEYGPPDALKPHAVWDYIVLGGPDQ